MMNVNVQNTNQVMQKTNAVGFLPQVAPKDVVQREDSSHSFLDNMQQGTDPNENPLQPSPQDMANAATAARAQEGQAAAQQQAQSRGRISQNTTVRQSWSAEAEEADEEGRGGPAAGGAGASQAGAAAENRLMQADAAQSRFNFNFQPYARFGQDGATMPQMEAPKFDTGSMIQLQYLANAGLNLVANVVMSAAEQALATKEWFLRNFFRLVDTEYKQYVKSDDAVYSRKNLREILSALGETINPFSQKNKKWRQERGLDKKGFDKLNQRLAGRTLQIFDEPPEEQQEQQQEPLEIVW